MDNLLDRIGGFGKFQRIVVVVIGSIASLAALVTYASVFNNAVPKLSCYYKNDLDKKIESDKVCNVWTNITQSQELNTESPYECVFDTEYYGVTIVTEFDLVCDRIPLTSLTQTIFMVGALSSFFAGYLSDRYGRRTVLLIMICLLFASILVCELLQLNTFGFNIDTKYMVYLVTQFILGFSSFAAYVISYVLLIEISSPKYHMLASVININIYVIGELILLVISYFLRNWHLQNYFIAAYALMIIVLIIAICPESAKYLYTNKRYEDAADVYAKIAKVNGVKVERSQILKELQGSETEKMLERQEEVGIVEKKTTVVSYLTSPIGNLFRTIALAYLFIALSMIYFGVSLGITSISKEFNPYFMYFCSSIAEFVGYTMSLLDRKFSKKSLMIFSLGVAGIVCIAVAFIPLSEGKEITWNSILIMTCAFTGKIMASLSFNLIYLYASQVYPSAVKNTLVSYVCCAGRVGSLISPQVNLLRDLVWDSLPYFIFSANALFSCFIFFFMPNAVYA